MKKLLVFLAVLAIAAFGAFAATKVDLVNYKDFDAATAGITEHVKAGWIPVGVDAFDDGDYAGIWILYTDTTPLTKKGGQWDFLSYKDQKALHADLDLAVKKGWTPIDFAEDSNFTYVLYLKTTAGLKNWDLKDVDSAVDEINSNAMSADEIGQGWVPVGVHEDADGKQSLLYAQFKSPNPVKAVDIAQYDDYSQLEKDVQANAAKGWTPVGFTADNEGKTITVIFIK